MSKGIALIRGHPDRSKSHLCHALADAYGAGAESTSFLVRNILKVAGIAPVRETLFGMVEDSGQKKRAGCLEKMRGLGAADR